MTDIDLSALDRELKKGAAELLVLSVLDVGRGQMKLQGGWPAAIDARGGGVAGECRIDYVVPGAGSRTYFPPCGGYQN